MQNNDNNAFVKQVAEQKYEYGFTTDVNTEIIECGLNEDVVTLISTKKGEPQWMLDFRLKAFRYWKTLKQPEWGHVSLPDIDYQAISYYADPLAKQKDNEKKDNQIDVSSVVRELVAQNVEPGAIKINQEDMGKLYQYISGLHDRFGIETHMILISLIWEEDVAMADVDKAMKAMEYSIIQSLRAVDVMTRVSESQYLIVLTEAHTQNIQMIIDRVFTSFFKSSQNTKIKPIYAIK